MPLNDKKEKIGIYPLYLKDKLLGTKVYINYIFA